MNTASLTTEVEVIRILYIDDRESNFRILERKLRKEAEDFAIVWEKDAGKAMDIIRENPFDCVIIDIDPDSERENLSLVSEIRNICSSIPIVLLTARNSERITEEASQSADTDVFIRKIGSAYFHGLANTIRNSVERDRSETRKERFEKLFVEAFMNSPVPAMLVNSDHRIIYWNQACEELTGYRSEDVVGTDAYRKMFTLNYPPFENLPDLILDGKSDEEAGAAGKIRKKDASSYEIEGYSYIPRVGRKFLRVAASPVKDSKGKIIAVIQNVLDLTDIVSAREELAQKNEQMFGLIGNSPVAVYIHQDGKFRMFNPKFSEMSGYPPEELREMDIWNLVHPEDVGRMKEYYELRLRGETVPENFTFRGIAKDGKIREFIGYFAIISYENRPAVLGQLIELCGNSKEENRAED